MKGCLTDYFQEMWHIDGYEEGDLKVLFWSWLPVLSTSLRRWTAPRRLGTLLAVAVQANTGGQSLWHFTHTYTDSSWDVVCVDLHAPLFLLRLAMSDSSASLLSRWQLSMKVFVNQLSPKFECWSQQISSCAYSVVKLGHNWGLYSLL